MAPISFSNATAPSDTSDAEKSYVSDERDVAPPPPSTDAPPDGGTAAWLVVLGAWCCCFTSYGWLSSIGVFQTYYQEYLLQDYSPSAISWILSVQVFVLTVLAPVNGQVFDSFGSRHLVCIGSFFHVFGLVMLSLSTEYYQVFLAQSICSGIGSACLYHGCINSANTWFAKKRGLALGIVASGASVGAIIVPILFDRTVERIGFGWAIRAIAFMFLGLQIIAIVTVRSRLVHHRKPVIVKAFVRPYYSDRKFLYNALGAFFTFWGNLIPGNYIVLAAQASGMTPYLSSYLIPIINASSLIGRIIPPWASDRIGRFNVAILTNLFAVIVIFAVWFPAEVQSDTPTLVFAVLYGFPLGCFSAILPALIGQISDVREIGVRYGATFFLTAWAGLTGNPIAGALLTRGQRDLEDGGAQFNYLKIFSGLTIAVGMGFLILARHVQDGWNTDKRRIKIV